MSELKQNIAYYSGYQNREIMDLNVNENSQRSTKIQIDGKDIVYGEKSQAMLEKSVEYISDTLLDFNSTVAKGNIRSENVRRFIEKISSHVSRLIDLPIRKNLDNQDCAPLIAIALMMESFTVKRYCELGRLYSYLETINRKIPENEKAQLLVGVVAMPLMNIFLSLLHQAIKDIESQSDNRSIF